jgi:hypothetical protein
MLFLVRSRNWIAWIAPLFSVSSSHPFLTPFFSPIHPVAPSPLFDVPIEQTGSLGETFKAREPTT